MAEKENWSRVRDRIDRGEEDDKVNFPDPAAAPLGTDEEAGGGRTPPEDLEPSPDRRRSNLPPTKKNGSGSRQLLIASIALAVILIALFLLL